MIGSCLSAFIIGAGAVLSGGFVGAKGLPGVEVFFLSAVFGAVAAAKDYRSQLKLPPIEEEKK